MSDLVIIERSDITAVADSIRNKTGITGDLTIGEMIDCIDSFSSGGSSEGMINMPEMCDVTLTFVRHSWASYEGDAEITCEYLGIDETNTLKKMSIVFYTGTSGTIHCVKNSFIEMSTFLMIWEDNWGTHEYYPQLETDSGGYVGANGADNTVIAVLPMNTSSITITVS